MEVIKEDNKKFELLRNIVHMSLDGVYFYSEKIRNKNSYYKFFAVDQFNSNIHKTHNEYTASRQKNQQIIIYVINNLITNVLEINSKFFNCNANNLPSKILKISFVRNENIKTYYLPSSAKHLTLINNHCKTSNLNNSFTILTLIDKLQCKIFKIPLSVIKICQESNNMCSKQITMKYKSLQKILSKKDMKLFYIKDGYTFKKIANNP